ncbi:MAG: hypothetical protein AAF806_21825 [Bacteroidota bacterium]
MDAAINPIYYGRIRKTRTSILDGYLPTADFIENTLIYDDFGRLTNTNGTNHLLLVDGAEQVLMEYDFADNLVFSSHGQTTPNTGITVQERMTYDHKGRQIDAFHQLTGNAEEHCSRLEYTDRDLVKTRFLGELGNDDFLQEVNYFYNGQRWLTSINRVSMIA